MIQTRDIFNCNIYNVFATDSDIISNSPVKIVYKNSDGNDKYLTANLSENIVELSPDANNNNDSQKWIFEKSNLKLDKKNNSERDESENSDFILCHIFATLRRDDKLKYIGAPNSDNNVYMYSSKNKFTLWKVRHMKDTNINNNGSNNDGNNDSNSNRNIYEISYVGEKFNPDDIQIVVARYNESIDWTNAYNDICVIYNKGNDIECSSKVIALPNVGREGHTYLYHIINCYDILKKKTIFTQAQFLEHNNTMFCGIDNYFEFTDPIQPMGLRYMQSRQIPPDHYVNKHKITTKYGFEYAVYNIDQNLVNVPAFRDDGIKVLFNKISNIYDEPKKMSITKGFLSRSKFPCYGHNHNHVHVHPSVLNSKINNLDILPKTFPFTYCALFCVDRDAIRKNSGQVYNNLITELIAKEKCGGSNGYVLERLWLYIFGYGNK
jgi:hypothetical protein